jgi:aryl-alcohol dehydrogenase-like predicted oxidoreductase
VIPGARNAAQAVGNAVAADLDPLPEETIQAIGDLYDRRIRPVVHDRW